MFQECRGFQTGHCDALLRSSENFWPCPLKGQEERRQQQDSQDGATACSLGTRGFYFLTCQSAGRLEMQGDLWKLPQGFQSLGKLKKKLQHTSNFMITKQCVAIFFKTFQGLGSPAEASDKLSAPLRGQHFQGDQSPCCPRQERNPGGSHCCLLPTPTSTSESNSTRKFKNHCQECIFYKL